MDEWDGPDDKFEITGFVPGALGRVTEMHGVYYHLHWGFGPYFEQLVGAELAEFLGRFDASHDGFWVARLADQVVGSITIDGGKGDRARLRWFILEERCQGRGIGRRLMEQALGFCRRVGFREVELSTFDGLHAARRLYEEFGFRLVSEQNGDHWGTTVKEQVFLLPLHQSNSKDRM